MTPPAKWYLDKDDGGSVVLCTFAPGDATSPGTVERQGTVSDIKTGLARGKPVVKVQQPFVATTRCYYGLVVSRSQTR